MRVAFVPSPPFLLPGLGGGTADLAAACREAAGRLHDPVTVLAPASQPGPVTGSVDATPWGATGLPADDPLPLGLAVGAALLEGRQPRLVGTTGEAMQTTGDLLVVGDGTAKRTEKAPGHLDPRAEGFDAQVLAALTAGDPQSLAALDADLAAELWAGGVPAWRSAAASLPVGSWDAEVLWSGAPYGVFYAVAVWVRR
jgi:hypothetical protein